MAEAKVALMQAVRELSNAAYDQRDTPATIFMQIINWKKEWYYAQLAEFRWRYPGVEAYPGDPHPIKYSGRGGWLGQT